MEPTETKMMKLWLGAYEVVESGYAGAIAIHLGKNITINVHPGDIPHTVKPGMKLHLYTEIPYAIPESTPKQ